MNLETLINTKQNFDNLFKSELLKMDCFFQEHLWNGYDDENDPKFITPGDFEAIEALTDKIAHMTLNIGCPISVRPMLDSIATRKIKHWQAENNHETKDVFQFVYDTVLKKGTDKLVKRGFKKGRQLKSKNEITQVLTTDGYYHLAIEKRILKGHFRWNNRGYILSRRAADLLLDYLESNF